MSPDYDTILSHLRASYRPGEVFEIRVLHRYTSRCQVGYFNDPVAAANTVKHHDDKGIAGFYATINAVHPECLNRAHNRLIDARGGSYTKDKEIPYRSKVFLDIDPIRPVSGISSTDAEHEEAIALAYRVDAAMQTMYGFPPAAIHDSGNGAHIEWETEPLPADKDTDHIIRAFLHRTRDLFQTSTQEFDAGNFNASRIKRLPGSIARKGEDTPDRPHRPSRILVPRDPLAPALTLSLIQSVTGPVQPVVMAPSVSPIQTPFDSLYRRLSDYALKHLDEWVPYIFGSLAYVSGEGYRISSDSLGREYTEAISITPYGITDFGPRDMGDPVLGKRTCPQLIAEVNCIDIKAAAELLSKTLNYPMNEFGSLPMQPAMNGHEANGSVMPASLLGGIEARLEDNISVAGYLKDYEPKVELVQDTIPMNQYALLYALPKVGKSTMSRQLAVAAVTGMDFMDREVKVTGEVLYVSYEEDERHWFSSTLETYKWMARQNGIEVTEQSIQALFDSIHLITNKSRAVGENSVTRTQFPRGEAGIEAIRQYVVNHPNVRLVILDPYEAIFDESLSRDIKKQQRNEGELIKRIYEGNQVAVVVVDHSKKEASRFDPAHADVMNGTSGTTQKPASADTIIAINVFPPLPDDKIVPGMPKGAIVGYMEAKGRGIPGFRDNVLFEGPFGWTKLEDDFPMPKLSDLREAGRGARGAAPHHPQLPMMIVTVLEKEGPKSANDLADVTNAPYQIVLRTVKKLVSDKMLNVDRASRTHMYYVPFNGHKLKDIL